MRKLAAILTLLFAGAAGIADENSGGKNVLPDVETATQTAPIRLAKGPARNREKEALPTDVIPLIINGQQWTFRTPPPKDLKIRPDHPRLLITADSIEAIQAKLGNPLYSKELQAIVKEPALQALFYAVFHDEYAGDLAKKALLELPQNYKPNYGSECFFWCLVYDWCHDMFTAAEREIAFDRICRVSGIIPPERGSAELNVTQKKLGYEGGFSYINNAHEPRTHSRGFQFRGVVALAFHGDGVRDEWCDAIFKAMLDGQHNQIYAIYEPKYGGLLDGHNTMALDSGGIQAGNHVHAVVSGYNGMFINTAPMLMAAWETATGDELFSRDNLYRRLPYWLAYEVGPGESAGVNAGLQVLRQITGIYKTIDPEMAGLAAWLCQKYGEGSQNELVTFLLGDKTVPPLSPEDLGLPTSAYLRGADTCFSRSAWSDNATMVELTVLTVDSNRHESAVGLLNVDSRGQKLLVTGHHKKGYTAEIYGSGVWIWRKGENKHSRRQGTTYWGGFHLRDTDERVGRANRPYEVATKSGYRGSAPTENHGDDTYHVFAVDSARHRSEHDRHLPMDVKKAKRTVVHLKPDAASREFVIVYDRVDVPSELTHCWGGRVMNKPTIIGNTFRASDKAAEMVGTVLAPTSVIDLRGGPGKATEGPSGERYDGEGYIFRDDDSGRDEFGSYSLFIKPKSVERQQDYCVVLEIGDTGFSPAEATLSGKVVRVGGWEVDFSVEDQTAVARK